MSANMDPIEAALNEKLTQLEQALRDAEEVESDAKDEVKRALAQLNAMLRKSKFEKNFREYDLVSAKIEADEAHFDWLDAQKTAQEAHALLICVEYEAQMYASGAAYGYQNAKQRTRQTQEEHRNNMNSRNALHNKRVLENRAKEAKAKDEEQAEYRARAERDRKAREKQERKYEDQKKQEKQKPRFFPPPPPPSARPDTRAAPREPKAFAEAVARWRVATEKYFNSPDQPFPEPPSQKCRKIGCQAQNEACPCNIKTAFEILAVDVKKERLSWHPDLPRFKPEDKARAKAVFVVIQSMHEKIELEKEKAKKAK